MNRKYSLAWRVKKPVRSSFDVGLILNSIHKLFSCFQLKFTACKTVLYLSYLTSNTCALQYNSKIISLKNPLSLNSCQQSDIIPLPQCVKLSAQIIIIRLLYGYAIYKLYINMYMNYKKNIYTVNN